MDGKAKGVSVLPTDKGGEVTIEIIGFNRARERFADGISETADSKHAGISLDSARDQDRTGEKPKHVSINTRKLVDVARVTPNLQTMGIVDAGADGGLDHGHGSRVGRTRLGKGLDVTVLAAAKRKDASGHGGRVNGL